MPLKNYRVLKSRPIGSRLATGTSNHYQVQVSANGTLFQIAINLSADGSEVQFPVRTPFRHVEGLKVDGVSYTEDRARQPGRTIPFQA